MTRLPRNSVIEHRAYEARADLADGNRLVGHASVFGQETRIGDFYEVVDPAAFTRALNQRQDVAMLVNHDGLPLGTTWAGTLRLSTDATGLAVDNDLPNTTLAADVRELAARGDLRSMSFGFRVVADEWSTREDGSQLRTLRDLDLFDVSVVTFPAYKGTDVALRAADLGAPRTPGRTSVRGQTALIRARNTLGRKS